MDSASFQFVIYGLAAAILSNLSRCPAWRSTVLFLASVIFLALLAHSPSVLLPLAAFLLLGYAGIALIERTRIKQSAWIIVAVIFVYIWLKKYTFLPSGIFLHFPYFTIGLSYIFFRVLHLLIELGDKNEKRHVGIGAYLLYTLNFTTLVSGPIQRYDEFVRDQFAMEPIPLGPRVVGRQMERIVRGFFKVNVLAMFLNMVQEDALEQIAQPSPMPLKLIAAFRLTVAYPFFLYCNFSGISTSSSPWHASCACACPKTSTAHSRPPPSWTFGTAGTLPYQPGSRPMSTIRCSSHSCGAPHR
jgi:D-alanyl-lipoteichoic acid acyltransferase DltB (MBOAT superfamily)